MSDKTKNESKNDTSQQMSIRRIDVRDLVGDLREAILLHGNEEYRLRVTASGKLILTK